jgi:hypothetical protein
MLKVDTCTMTEAVSCQHVIMDVRFHSRPVHVGFVVNRVAAEKVLPGTFPVSIILPVLRTHFINLPQMLYSVNK